MFFYWQSVRRKGQKVWDSDDDEEMDGAKSAGAAGEVKENPALLPPDHSPVLLRRSRELLPPVLCVR